jgi:SAM-dependent methyltransferase
MANNQQEVWDREHASQQAFATMHTLKPSRTMQQFAQFLVQVGVSPGQERLILDIGCGKGRNSIFFAQLGYQVFANDFSEKALDDARQRTAQHQVSIEYERVNLAEDWPYAPNTFDAIIDANTSVFIPAEGREVAIQEAHRVLKPNGFYLFYGMAHLPQEQPAATYAEKGFSEKRYTLDELKQAYQTFTLIQADQVPVTDIMDGAEVTHQMWKAIFQKG